MGNQPPVSEITPGLIARILVAVLATLIVVHLFLVYIKYFVPDYYFGFFRMFDVDIERSYPTVFNTFLYFINATLFLAVWSVDRNQPRSGVWLFLSLLFYFLMLDEFGGLHERTAAPMDRILGDLGVANIAWIFLYLPIVAILGLFLWRWFWSLDPQLRKRLMIAGVIFFSGAIGVELAEGYQQRRMNMEEDLIRQLLCTVEETLEMGGLIYLTWSLLMYFKERKGGYIIRI